MSEHDIETIKARLAAATPGPWSWDDWEPKGLEGESRYEWSTVKKDVIRVTHYMGGWSSACGIELEVEEADAQLIAHAPEDLAGLCDEVERLRGYKAAWEELGHELPPSVTDGVLPAHPYDDALDVLARKHGLEQP